MAKFTEIALEEGMPASRALRRRARTYLGEAANLAVGKSGLTEKEKAKGLKQAAKFAAAAAADFTAALEALASE